MGLAWPSSRQRSMTSWARRCISGLALCTEAKSSASSLAPEAIEEAAPPPSPISIAGPPRTITLAPVGMRPLATWGARMLPTPPASMMGLW